MRFKAEIICQNNAERAFFNKIKDAGEAFYSESAPYIADPPDCAGYWIEQKFVETYPQKHLVIINGASPNPVWQALGERVLIPRLDLATRFASYFLSTAGQERAFIQFSIGYNTGPYQQVVELNFGLKGATLVPLDSGAMPDLSRSAIVPLTRSTKYPGVSAPDLHKMLCDLLLNSAQVD